MAQVRLLETSDQIEERCHAEILFILCPAVSSEDSCLRIITGEPIILFSVQFQSSVSFQSRFACFRLVPLVLKCFGLTYFNIMLVVYNAEHAIDSQPWRHRGVNINTSSNTYS